MKNKIILSLLLVCALAMPIFTKALTSEEIRAQIADLQLKIAALQQQMTQTSSGVPDSWCHTFNINFGLGSSGEEVTYLQVILQKQGLYQATIGGLSNFDGAVSTAVTKFQEKYASEILTPIGLKRGNGYVGKSTRAKLNKLYGCANSKTVNRIVCSADVKQCPDGSYVSRGGVNCEFSQCPTVSSKFFDCSAGHSCSYNLPAGWSLISFPLNLSNNNLDSVLSSIKGKYDVVFAYDNDKKIWLYHYSDNEPSNNLSAIESNKGYFIKMYEPAVLTVQGEPLNLSSGTWISNLGLKPGWNLVGYGSSQAILDIQGAGLPATVLEIDKLKTVSFSSNSSAANQKISMSANPQDFLAYQFQTDGRKEFTTLDPGYGYWINVATSTKIETDIQLIAWWKFDEASGDSAVDSSANGNTGALVGGVQRVSGAFGGALQFDGKDDYVSVPNVNVANDITIEAWVSSANFAQRGGIIGEGEANSADSDWLFFFDGASKGLSLDGARHVLTCRTNTWLPANNQWHHLVGVISGLSGSIYVDGALKASGVVNAIGNNGSIIRIGSSSLLGNIFYPFNGLIDDVRIYNYARTAEQIKADYDASAKLYAVSSGNSLIEMQNMVANISSQVQGLLKLFGR